MTTRTRQKLHHPVTILGSGIYNMLDEFRSRQRQLVERGKKVLEESTEFGLHWDWTNGLRGETRDIMEEKVPMLAAYRDYYQRWNKWPFDSAEFVREVAGLRSDSNRKFKQITASTQELFKAHHSPMNKIHEGISSQLELVPLIRILDVPYSEIVRGLLTLKLIPPNPISRRLSVQWQKSRREFEKDEDRFATARHPQAIPSPKNSLR